MLSRITQKVSKGGAEILAESRRSATSSSSTVVTKANPDRFRTFCLFGGEKIPFSFEDKHALKQGANANPNFASLILLGFRDQTSIPVQHTLEQAYFCYPNEERTKGSTTAFAHLHASMLRKGVVAVGELLARATATSHLVAFWPLEEEVEDVGEGECILKRPPGMMIVTLPFEDELRSIATDAAVQALEGGSDIASDEVVNAAMRLVEKQTRDVEIGEEFENARVSAFWDYVEHVALGDPLPTSKEYDTIPDQEKMRQWVGEEANAFAAALPDDVKVEPKKRKLVATDGNGLDWEAILRDDLIDKVLNADLKKKLSSYGEKQSGKKQDLIERLLPHLTNEFSDKKVEEENPFSDN
jgi:hypothetical protein